MFTGWYFVNKHANEVSVTG